VARFTRRAREASPARWAEGNRASARAKLRSRHRKECVLENKETTTRQRENEKKHCGASGWWRASLLPSHEAFAKCVCVRARVRRLVCFRHVNLACVCAVALHIKMYAFVVWGGGKDKNAWRGGWPAAPTTGGRRSPSGVLGEGKEIIGDKRRYECV
jgi:hypothetical protein